MLYNNAEGLVFVLVFFVFALIINYSILAIYKLNKRDITYFVLLSVFLHFTASTIGCLFLSNIATGDAVDYFNNANFYQNISSHSLQSYTSTYLILHIVYWLRYLIFGDSFLGTFSFFALLGSLGATFYLIIFYKLLHYVESKYEVIFSSLKIKIFSLLILLWPSNLYWTSNIGKDSLCYFFISLFFLFLLEIKHETHKICHFFSLFFSSAFVFLVRPYLILVAFLGNFCVMLFQRKTAKSILLNLFLLILLSIVFFPLLGMMVNFLFNSTADISSILNNAVFLQKSQAVGSHIPLPTHDPAMVVFFLPYTMLANLFLPMFIFAYNAIGILASFENLFLFIIVLFFFGRLRYWKLLARNNNFFSITFWFFVSGVFFLGLVNTNLGASMREKTMYLPLFLINMFVVLSLKYKKNRELL